MTREDQSALEAIQRLKKAVQRMIIGQEHLIDRLIIGLLTQAPLIDKVLRPNSKELQPWMPWMSC